MKLWFVVSTVEVSSLLDFILLGKSQLTSNPIIGKLKENIEKPVGIK